MIDSYVRVWVIDYYKKLLQISLSSAGEKYRRQIERSASPPAFPKQSFLFSTFFRPYTNQQQSCGPLWLKDLFREASLRRKSLWSLSLDFLSFLRSFQLLAVLFESCFRVSISLGKNSKRIFWLSLSKYCLSFSTSRVFLIQSFYSPCHSVS